MNGNRVVYADGSGVAVRAAVAGTYLGDRYQPGDLLWDAQGDHTLIDMARELGGRAQFYLWHKSESNPSPLSEAVLHRTLCHQVAVHKGAVLFVDDAGFLPPPKKPGAVGTYGVLGDAAR